jgi:hypothetical protein
MTDIIIGRIKSHKGWASILVVPIVTRTLTAALAAALLLGAGIGSAGTALADEKMSPRTPEQDAKSCSDAGGEPTFDYTAGGEVFVDCDYDDGSGWTCGDNGSGYGCTSWDDLGNVLNQRPDSSSTDGHPWLKLRTEHKKTGGSSVLAR